MAGFGVRWQRLRLDAGGIHSMALDPWSARFITVLPAQCRSRRSPENSIVLSPIMRMSPVELPVPGVGDDAGDDVGDDVGNDAGDDVGDDVGNDVAVTHRARLQDRGHFVSRNVGLVLIKALHVGVQIVDAEIVAWLQFRNQEVTVRQLSVMLKLLRRG